MDQEIIIKLTKDMKAAVETMTNREARYLTDFYYQMQDNRIRAASQIRAAKKEPHSVLLWFENNASSIENQIKAALDAFAQSKYMGRWAMANNGVGCVTAAGLLGHLAIEMAPTAGHYWSFAGLTNAIWEKGKKRPWCASLKVICWKLWQSWLKLKNHPDCFYGKLMTERKDKEWKRNLDGELADQCKAMLDKKDFKKLSNARAWYEGRVDVGWAREMVESGKPFPLEVKLTKNGALHPMLPPGHIQSRAGRWAVKLFLAHYHGEEYRHHYHKEPPLPYPIAIQGHAHLIESPVAQMPE